MAMFVFFATDMLLLVFSVCPTAEYVAFVNFGCLIGTVGVTISK